MTKKKEPLKIIGIIAIILGILIILSALPFVSSNMFEVGLIKTDIPEISATRLAVGIVLVILGLIIYFGKEGLKALGGR